MGDAIPEHEVESHVLPQELEGCIDLASGSAPPGAPIKASEAGMLFDHGELRCGSVGLKATENLRLSVASVANYFPCHRSQALTTTDTATTAQQQQPFISN